MASLSDELGLGDEYKVALVGRMCKSRAGVKRLLIYLLSAVGSNRRSVFEHWRSVCLLELPKGVVNLTPCISS